MLLGWRIRFTPKAEKNLSALGVIEARRVLAFLQERVTPDPRGHGGPLKGQLREFWRWRVGDIRILGRIEEDHLIVLVVHVEHRSKVYSKK